MLDWDRSHEYVLHRIFRDVTHVAIHFQSNSPTVDELLALRRLIPELSQQSPAQLRKSIGNAGRYVIGDVPTHQAHELRAAAERQGLTVLTTDASSYGYIPFDVTTGCGWLIEDENESAAVVDAMLAEGVPVLTIES